MTLSFKEQAAIAVMAAIVADSENWTVKNPGKYAWDLAEALDAERKRRVPGTQPPAATNAPVLSSNPSKQKPQPFLCPDCNGHGIVDQRIGEGVTGKLCQKCGGHRRVVCVPNTPIVVPWTEEDKP